MSCRVAAVLLVEEAGALREEGLTSHPSSACATTLRKVSFLVALWGQASPSSVTWSTNQPRQQCSPDTVILSWKGRGEKTVSCLQGASYCIDNIRQRGTFHPSRNLRGRCNNVSSWGETESPRHSVTCFSTL